MQNLTGSTSNKLPDKLSGGIAEKLARYLACSLKCFLTLPLASSTSDETSGAISDELPEFSDIGCVYGFTCKQLIVLKYIAQYDLKVIKYEKLTTILNSCTPYKWTTSSVKGIVGRLERYHLLTKKHTKIGVLQGIQVKLTGFKICKFIYATSDKTSDATFEQISEHTFIPKNAHLSLDREIDKNLSLLSKEDESIAKLKSLTDADIAFHWQELARAGFKSDQIRQILQRLEQVNIKASDNIFIGLTYAEWELINGAMFDSRGKRIEKPVDWVFKILATQGYYPRPKGYISPQEQAERDLMKEQERVKKQEEEDLKKSCKIWIESLKPLDKQKILDERKKGRDLSLSEDIVLRLYFQENIWQKDKIDL